MALAMFDIDGTLVSGASAELRFYAELIRSGHQGPRQVIAYLESLPSAVRRHGGAALQHNKSYLSGLPVATIRQLAIDWADACPDRCWYRPALQRLREHQARRDEVMFLSGTPDFLATALAATLGVPHAVGTPVSVMNDRFAPLDTDHHVSGAEKLRVAEYSADSMGFAASDIVAYGNSYQDMALLSWAGTPIAVRPDRRLAAVARAQGWTVINRSC
jgi:phosphoserine phosphatase